MQQIKTNSSGNNDETVKPKRRIVHRIVRRVPKPKIVEATLPEETKPAPKIDAVFQSESQEVPKIIKHGVPAMTILADEKPVSSELTTTPKNINSLPEEKSPKERILEELSITKEKITDKPQISHDSLDPSAKNPIANIWPYIAASKQQSKDELETREHKFTDDDSEEEEQSERNYFSWIPWVVIPLIVTGIVVFVLSYLSGAEVIVTPKFKSIPIETDLVSEKNSDQTKSVPLTILLIEDKVTSDVAATESKTTIATASGKVTVSNKQKVVQTLIKTTRFESADGKIYRIRENIKVPAQVGDKPGTVDVMVYAESAGPEYNKKEQTDFTIPGFKGKPQFQLVTAKSIGQIDGGSSGVKKSVPKETMDELSKNMRIELENKLRARVARELLQSQVGFDSLYQFDYKEAVLEASDAPEKARIALSGTLAVPIFNKSELSRELAKANIEGYVGEEVSISNIEQLSVKITEGQKVNLFADSKASFHFSGETKFVWVVDSKAFAKALMNVSKNDTERVSKRFAGIDKVSATLHPFWKSYFPGNVNDIKVVVTDPIQ